MGAGRMDKSEEFANGKTLPLIIRYSIPTITGMLVNALYSFTDRVFVGNLGGGEGELGMAAINIAMPVLTIIFAVAMFAGVGAAANISLSLGRGRRDQAEQYIGNGLTLGAAVSFVASALFVVFRTPILRAFGASGGAAGVLGYAETYLSIMLLGTTINTFGFCLSRYILAQGFTTVSMAALIIGTAVNIVLTPLFMFVFHWGIAGSAIATVVAQAVSAAFSLQFFLRNKMPLSIRRANLRPDWPVLGRIAAIGVSPGLLQLAMAFVQVLINNVLKGFGDGAISAMSAVNAVSMVLLMPVFGINQGAQPIIGFNYGAENYRRVRRLLIQTILLATGLMSVFWIFLMLFAGQIIRLFGTDNRELMRLGPMAIRQFLMALPLVGFQVVSSTYFQSVGKPRHSLALTLSRQVLFLVPAILILPQLLGINGVFLSGAVADSMATVLTAVFFAFELRNLSARAKRAEA